MKQVTTLFLWVFFTSAFNAQIFNDITKPKLSQSSLAEKIYLQIDNAIYQTGETIWFKAIVSKSYDNSLSDISEILHVELIDFNETIIDKKLLKLKGGIGSGSFVLEDSYKTGKYLVRAFTKWNRNFEEDFIYSQSLDVINVKDETVPKKPIINVVVGTGDFKTIKADINPKILDSKFKGNLKLYIDTGFELDSIELSKNKNDVYKLDYKLPKNTAQANLKFKYTSYQKKFRKEEIDIFSETVIVDKDYLDVQFFPESGKLVSGLLSTVAFKAIDYKGLGYEVSGEIKDNNDDLITSFSGNKLGMGTFKLKPERSKSYYAEIIIKNRVYRYNLPVVNLQGSVMSLVNLKNDIKFLIASNSKTTDNFVVQTQARGVKYHSLVFKYEDTIKASIPKLSLPDGIVKVSLLNDKRQIICERLFFNDRLDNRLSIELATDKSSYSQRDRVSLTLRLDSLQSPGKTNFSTLVLDKSRMDTAKGFKSHILSYLLVSSELKGFVENPSYYFNKTNKERLMDLDALLLTQGWRSYKYDKLSGGITYNHSPEKNLVVSGTVGEYFNPKKRPKKPLDINLMVYGEPLNAYTQEIDSKGKYYFELDDIYKPNTELFMQVVNKKGSPIDFNINLDKQWSPEIAIQKEQMVTIPEYFKTNFTERIESHNKIQRDYETSYNTIALEEVNIKGYKLTPEREAFMEIHGEPDIVIDGKELNEVAPEWNYGVFSVLKSKYKEEVDVVLVGPPTGRQWLLAKVKNYDFTYILLDNIPVFIDDYSRLQDVPSEEVESIDILRNPKDKNRYCEVIFNRATSCPERVALINIYTKSRSGFYGMTRSKGVLVDFIDGFSKSVKFYSPNYETLSNQDWVIPDNRSVIHWEPNITLNTNGEYHIEFYNDDHVGEVSVIVEAISKDGKIGYVEKTYTVNEAER